MCFKKRFTKNSWNHICQKNNNLQKSAISVLTYSRIYFFADVRLLAWDFLHRVEKDYIRFGKTYLWIFNICFRFFMRALIKKKELWKLISNFDWRILRFLINFVKVNKNLVLATYEACTRSQTYVQRTLQLDILFSSNHNIHKSSYGLCFWASDPLIDRFLLKSFI